ncbi:MULTISPECIES: hypothetical protein [unclassified Pseudoalteromonas]|uniref:hypothetical protein n=1 Tax=unclassified Pseudoalteromonas TaxID=194690 RepID=UPI00209735EE|nr:hypothetical protein [Pseudoalteromonas sp. XMcav2-N]MCO7189647.1 hypothetical protein [Pseudoalteromonas sp. XMcav2-N]
MMKNSAKLCIVLALGLTALSGCKSAKRDDYVAAVELNKGNYIAKHDVRLLLNPEMSADIRGRYSNNRSIEQGSMLYAAGTPASALAQVFAHAAINSSLQENKLSQQQTAANKEIQPFKDTIGEVSIGNLLSSDYLEKVVSSDVGDFNSVNVKPIFFVSGDLSHVSLKLVSWIDAPGKTKKGAKRYQNIIEVHAEPFSDEVIRQIRQGANQQQLKSKLSAMLNRAIKSLHDDLVGAHANMSVQQTIKIKSGNRTRFIRGNVIARSCDYTILKNLRKWIIHYPSSVVANETNSLQACHNVQSEGTTERS